MKNYFSFQWHITDDCDQRCKHCYIFSENCNKQPDSMSWQQMQDTFYNCLDFCQVYDRLPYFYLTGGDPILHPDFWKLLALMRENGIPFTILGNPFHLTDEVCRRLKAYGCQKYQLSIDGLRQTHDWFRKPGSFDITLEKIGCINRAGLGGLCGPLWPGDSAKVGNPHGLLCRHAAPAGLPTPGGFPSCG